MFYAVYNLFDMFCFNWFFGSPVRYPIATVEPPIKDTLNKTPCMERGGDGLMGQDHSKELVYT